MNVNWWRVPEKLVDSIQVKVSFPALTAEWPKTTCVMCFSRTKPATALATVGDFNLTTWAPTASAKRRWPPASAGWPHCRPLRYRHKQRIAHRLTVRHSRGPGNELLCGRVGADGDRKPFAYSEVALSPPDQGTFQDCGQPPAQLPGEPTRARRSGSRDERNLPEPSPPGRADKYRRAACGSGALPA